MSCKGCLRGRGGGVTSGYERMNETHLSVFHSISNRARGKRLGTLSTLFFSLEQETFTTFTLHDFTDFYVERATAHRIKINDHSCFHNRRPNSKTKLKSSLRARGVSGAQRSWHILRIGRIGSASTQNRHFQNYSLGILS